MLLLFGRQKLGIGLRQRLRVRSSLWWKGLGSRRKGIGGQLGGK